MLMRYNNRFCSCALAAAFMLTASTAPAATFTWNGGVAGVWTAGGAGWTPGNYPLNGAATDTEALFSGTTPLAVTLTGTVEANLLTFTASGYTISGGTQISLNGTAPTISVASGLSDTINSVLASGAGMIKTGTGTLTLGGSNTGLSGGVTVSQGELVLNNANAASTSG